VENALSVLRQILELAIEDKRLSRNPCVGVKAPRRQHRARGYLTHEQVELLARELDRNVQFSYGTVVRFLAYTGLRWGEMAALRVESMDMLRRRVNIRQAVAEVGGKVLWSSPEGLRSGRGEARSPDGGLPAGDTPRSATHSGFSGDQCGSKPESSSDDAGPRVSGPHA
jgi:integrase